MCGQRQPAEPSITEAQRCQPPRTQDESKDEKNKKEEEFEWNIGRASMPAQTSSMLHELFWQMSNKDPTSLKTFLHTCDCSGSQEVQWRFSPEDVREHGLLSDLGAAWWLEVNGEIWEVDKRAMAAWKLLLNGQRVQVNALVFDLILQGKSTQHVNSAGCSPSNELC